MTRRAAAAVALVTSLLLSRGLSAQGPGSASPPALEFDSVADFLTLPDGMNFGEVSGVAVNSRGHVFVFTRSNSANGPAYAPTAAQLLEFGAKGEFIREVGKNLYGWSFAHTVRIDRQDNIWAVDKGSDMVIKFDPKGRVREVYGRRKESADEESKPWEHANPPLPHVDGLFRQPTDVAWDSQGNSYITDGYVNARVAKYDKHGDWVMSWGEHGSGPGQFNTPHSIVIDRGQTLYVADRQNNRVQTFDTDGNLKKVWDLDGPPWSLCITPGPNQVVFVGSVGEEGLGDLRGVRHLFQKGPFKDRITAFITVDSPDMHRIVTGGVVRPGDEIRMQG